MPSASYQPAGGVVVPADQAGHPGQFEYSGGGEVDVAVAADAVFGLGAGASGSPGGDLTEADDHYESSSGVLTLPRSMPPACFGTAGEGRAWMVAGRSTSSALSDARSNDAASSGRDTLASGESTGEVGIQRRGCGFGAGFGGAQAEQFVGDFVWAVDVDAVLFHQRHERVVSAHEVGASHPADAGLGEADVLGQTLSAVHFARIASKAALTSP